MAVQIFPSPLRYPGGKLKVANYVKSLFMLNNLLDGDYAEPYAGGCSVALSLLFGKYASRIFINDKDPDVYAFWHSVLNEPNELVARIDEAKVDIDSWLEMRDYFDNKRENQSLLDRGFAAFYMNRTNRSGILEGGVIGGKDQEGDWKVDARFNKPDLIQRIRKIARFKDRIFLTNHDAQVFLAQEVPKMNKKKSLIYLDPPYYNKGQGLYPNAYEPQDHAAVAKDVAKLKRPWLVSYDNTTEIHKLYKRYRALEYGLYHRAANHSLEVADSQLESIVEEPPLPELVIPFTTEETNLPETVAKQKISKPRRKGKEVMFFSRGLIIPEGIDDPSAVTTKQVHQLQLSF